MMNKLFHRSDAYEVSEISVYIFQIDANRVIEKNETLRNTCNNY